MRPSQLHRQNSAFVRSSALGEIHASPVIQEVTIARGNGASRVIVKDGHFTQNSFKFPIHSNITITARLIGKGYFYATFEFNGEQHLAFVTPVTPNLTYTFSNEKKLMGLNFHISPTIPTHFSPTYMDTKSKVLLQKNPQTYNNLGFIPIEPVTDNSTDDKWGGRLNEHKWKYGHSGSAITPGQEVRYWANYDGGWIGSSSMYKYTAPGWECVQQYTANLQVGQPHCIVTQLIGYRDTYGVGGEYHPYTNSGNTNVAWGDYATHFKGANIRLMQQSFVNTYAIKPGDATASPKQGRNNFFIQAYDDYDNGGVVANNFQGSYKFPTTVEAGAMQDPDKYCAKVEWWNPTTNEWSLPAIYPPWDPRVRSNGTFAVYFRFPRQLSENDEFYDLTPQWRLDKTLLSYPRYNSLSDDVQYARIGRPSVAGGSKSVALQDAAGNEIRTSSESPFYQVMICPEAKSEDGKYDAADYQKKSYIRTSGDCVYAAVDPVAYSYADNPDIIKAYWKDGNFKPGGTFMLLGKALDMFPGLWVSTKSFSSKGNTPMDLQSQQFDMVRGEPQPNAHIADRVPQPKSMKLVNVDIQKKVNEFQPHWDKCFPGVPLTKSILTALLRGDQLPELEGITNTLLSGFLEDDPLRYETKYEGQTYKHSYTMSLCTIPEGWWGPTIEIESIGEGDSPQITTKSPDKVYIGGNNFYEYIKEEHVNLSDEIKYQVAIEAQGYTAAEQFAASELENPMVDVTFDAYKSRNETVAEAINDQSKEEQKKNWFLRTEQVKFRHRKFSLLGAPTITDATQQYSADHHTSLDGISPNNVKQYGFDELYLVQGLGNQLSTVIMPPKEPSGSIPIKHSNVANFGNSGRAALKARALGQGNPMKYSTEEKQDNDRPQQLGTLTDQALGFEDGAINNAITTGMVVGGIAIALGAVLKVKPMLDNMSTAASRKREARTRADTAEIDFLNKINKK
jgi:hypothetical protein